MSALTFEQFSRAADVRNVEDLPAALRPQAFRPSTDSRTLQAGEAFVCLRGPNHDGHAFAAAAVERGAVAIVADEQGPIPLGAGVPVLRVADTKSAYMRGAAAARRRVR